MKCFPPTAVCVSWCLILSRFVSRPSSLDNVCWRNLRKGNGRTGGLMESQITLQLCLKRNVCHTEADTDTIRKIWRMWRQTRSYCSSHKAAVSASKQWNSRGRPHPPVQSEACPVHEELSKTRPVSGPLCVSAHLSGGTGEQKFHCFWVFSTQTELGVCINKAHHW